jgi:hypothetical protein
MKKLIRLQYCFLRVPLYQYSEKNNYKIVYVKGLVVVVVVDVCVKELL